MVVRNADISPNFESGVLKIRSQIQIYFDTKISTKILFEHNSGGKILSLLLRNSPLHRLGTVLYQRREEGRTLHQTYISMHNADKNSTEAFMFSSRIIKFHRKT